MMKSMVVISYMLLAICNIQLTHGSAITFNPTPNVILDGLTPFLTLRCDVKDTATSASVIGRRDVTQTADNMAAVTSIVLMKDGQDVASVSANRPAHVMDGSVNTQVAGSVGQGGEGFLQVTFADPGRNQSGEFSCEANAVGESGHTVTFLNTLELSVNTPTIADLVTYIRALQHENEVLKTKVFFSAGLTKTLNLNSPQVVVYDKVFSNVGASYDVSSSTFTCQIAGYYEFTLSATNVRGQRFYIHLQKNGQNIMEVHALNGGYDGDSNSVIVKVAQGDVVRALADGDTHIQGGTNLMYNTFSGKLLMVN